MDFSQAMNRATEYLGPILLLIGTLAAIVEGMSKTVKPITGLIKWLRGKFGSGADKKLDKLTGSIAEVKDMVAAVSEENVNQNSKLDKLQAQIIENEKSRLSEYIFRMGHIARQGRPISEREFALLGDSFTKYHDVLKGNGRTAEEYEFVRTYYNSQGWKKKGAYKDG